MPTAKSYQNLIKIGEPYQKNGRMYVVVECANGRHKEVRWYTNQEYAKMYPDEAVAEVRLRSRKSVLGFDKGYITIFGEVSEDDNEWLKQSSARFHTIWGWYFVSQEPLPNLPSTLKPKQLLWESVAYPDEDLLKSDNVIQEAVAALVYEESASQFQGTVGDRIDRELLVVKEIEIPNNMYGPSNMYIMVDSAENEYLWTTSARKLEVGENYSLRGSVKEHKVYRNKKQTVLTRCTIR